ncbi:MAG: BspA family leucine-rich repeat surface protein [Bacteroidales bacterium]|nr:BspA family leucine-rich repeat surface protein [Bacteroidales bacterium]
MPPSSTKQGLRLKDSPFNEDISKWDVRNVEDMKDMFYHSPLEANPPK